MKQFKPNVFFVERAPIVKEYPNYVKVVGNYFGKVHFKHIKQNTKRPVMNGRTQTLDLPIFNLCYELGQP